MSSCLHVDRSACIVLHATSCQLYSQPRLMEAPFRTDRSDMLFPDKFDATEVSRAIRVSDGAKLFAGEFPEEILVGGCQSVAQ